MVPDIDLRDERCRRQVRCSSSRRRRPSSKALEKSLHAAPLWEASDRGRVIAGGRAARARRRLDRRHDAGRQLAHRRLPKLEIISASGSATIIDVPQAATHGIVVTNTPDVLTDEVADPTLGLMLCTVRELPRPTGICATAGGLRRIIRSQGDAAQSHGRDRRARPHRQGDRAAARRHAGAGRLSRPSGPGRRAYRHYGTSSRWRATVDVLVVVTPGGPETKNMINAAVLEALGPDGILINMARGSVVDEPALIEALRTKKILSAGLDVLSTSRRCRRAHRHGARRIIPASRLGLGPHAARHGPVGGRQSRRLGCRTPPAHTGPGNAVAACKKEITMLRAHPDASRTAW